MAHLTLVLLFGFLLLPGLFMVFIPMLPAIGYMFAGALMFAFADGFSHLTLSNLALLGGLLAFSVAVDWGAGLLGAKFGGAGRLSLLYGLFGSLAGFFALPPFGTFAGLFIGVLVGELMRKKSRHQAVQAGAGALLGSLSGVAVNVCIALLFLGLFVWYALF